MNQQKEEEKLDPRIEFLGQVLKTDLDLISSDKKKDPHAMIEIIGVHLRSHNVHKMDVYFYGGGDSGDIDSIDLYFKEGTENTTLYSYKHTGVDLWDTIWEWSHAFLNTCQTDWYNNDGGDGHLIFTIDEETGKGTFNYEVNYNETVSHTGESGEEEF